MCCIHCCCMRIHSEKTMDLKSFFEINNKVAVAFSGGVDSSFLLFAAVNSGADVTAYYVKSQFQPDFEFRDAKTVADRCGATLRVIEIDVLSEARKKCTNIQKAQMRPQMTK